MKILGEMEIHIEFETKILGDMGIHIEFGTKILGEVGIHIIEFEMKILGRDGNTYRV